MVIWADILVLSVVSRLDVPCTSQYISEEHDQWGLQGGSGDNLVPSSSHPTVYAQLNFLRREGTSDSTIQNTDGCG